MRKETYKIKCPKHIVFGDPLYFEEYKGERLKKLVVDYEVPAKFDTARLVLEEKPFEKCPRYDASDYDDISCPARPYKRVLIKSQIYGAVGGNQSNWRRHCTLSVRSGWAL